MAEVFGLHWPPSAVEFQNRWSCSLHPLMPSLCGLGLLCILAVPEGNVNVNVNDNDNDNVNDNDNINANTNVNVNVNDNVNVTVNVDAVYGIKICLL